ncbi:MAG TPA: Ig-like domain-containing protein [Verrucomicrobiae bacterium]|nr:Ig-like domain-containing protein [Verrucomicrobiae bacterium]
MRFSSFKAFKKWLGALFLLSLGAAAQAQQGLQDTNSVDTNSTNYVVADIGGNYRVWQQTVPAFTNESGQVIFRTNSYQEIATGLNFLSNGVFVASSENIEITSGGGAATNGQHQVYFAANINASNAVQITTPDGLQLNTHIMGLSYYDSGTGSNVLFAELQDSTGQLVTNNQVVYPNAFTDCDADVRYTYTRAGFEQDIVVQQQLPAPDSFGLNPDTTWLQVWTEFTDPPTPAIEPILDGADERLDFGIMKMERGKAFVMGSESNSVPVNKAWTTVEGRTFLVEQVQFDDVATQLQSLPAYSGGGGGTNGTGVQQIRFQGFPKKLPPAPTLVKRANEKLKLAGTRPPEKGLVLDYLLKNGSITNLTFQGDTTYLITGNVNLYSNTVIEGGTVVKFTNSNPNLTIYGPVTCQTAPYQMAVFTAKDDNTVGQQISGSTGSPSGDYAEYAIDLESGGSSTLQYLRICNASFGCVIDSTQTNVIKHCQFVNENNAVELITGTLKLQNVLFNNIASTTVEGINNATISAENITVDNAYTFFTAGFDCTLNLTNSLLVSVTSLGSAFNSTDSQTNLTDPGVFQTAGAGNFYLAAGSPYRDAGTTNIDPTLLADLQNMTTYPPILPAGFPTEGIAALSTSATFYPQAQRDYDTPDLGYHYQPIDYMPFADYSNCVVTFTNGVVIGYWGFLAISLDNYGQLVSQGTPNQKNVFAYYTLVQEQSTNLGASQGPTYPAASVPISAWHPTLGQYPTINMRFTSIYAPQGANYVFYFPGNYGVNSFTLRDCETFGAGTSWQLNEPSGGVFGLTNNLFQYTHISSSVTGAFNGFNNLYRGNTNYSYSMSTNTGGIITNQDNAFDATSVSLSGTGGHNAFLNGAITNSSLHAGDIVTNLTWVAGPLGNYYQSTNSPLINAGSTTADQLGLYHYTVTTNEVTETNSTVDIGYHYVALGTNGLPLDSNGNGIPDYLEDANGSGLIWIILTSPINGTYYAEPATIALQATVSDWRSIITNVTFYQGSIGIIGVTNIPYNYTWPIVAAGSYSLTAIAQDLGGLSFTSAPVNIAVTNLCSH